LQLVVEVVEPGMADLVVAVENYAKIHLSR
jgi:hypothetical protein